MRIGSIDVQPLFDGVGREHAGEIISRFSNAEAWRCHPEVFGHDGAWEFPVGGFLVRTGDRVIVVDTGVGPMDDGRYRGGDLPEHLRRQGVAPEEVTDVLFTHLHFDHIGWASVDGTTVFPRAVHRVHEADWAHFVDGPTAVDAAREKLDPVRERLELFSEDTVLAPGVDARWTPGHTPGSTVFVLSSGTERALLLGDVVHATVQFAERDWTVVWDVDPQRASAQRNRIADDAARDGDILVAAHFPDLRFGRILASGGSRRFAAI
ncbi:MBL fold metallo-hydrolase [Microbacterium resistens]|uniref:MBL fold metallo-hydrolase n=1 Tax=Microbacterium resistens TaxID=156977 RepID=UPI00082C7A60|nr:MBL fold metallo-hydrolase [Microbacterium resistens]